MNTTLNYHVALVTDNLRDFQKAVEYLASMEVVAGIPDIKADRHKQNEPLNNAQILYIHDNGSPSMNIPPRPVLEPGIQLAQAKINALLVKAGDSALAGKNPEKLLHAVGVAAQNGLRKRITQGPFVPLAKSTLKARKRRGRTGSRPLVDTGELRNALSYVVRKKT